MSQPAPAPSGGALGGVTLGGRAAWIALILITLTQAMSMVDRQILAILAPRIKADLHVGDAEMGLLYGTVFALFYALFSLPLGRLADGWVRTRLLALSITAWSLMTMLAGAANSFSMLAVSRLGVGIGEASAQPAGFSIISDTFPKARRGLAASMIAAGVALGLGSALWIGGAVADGWDGAFAKGAPLGLHGWQAAFIVAALPGFLLAFLLSRLPEPVRGAADGIVQAPDPHPFRASWEVLSAILPGFAWIGLARRKAAPGQWAANLFGLAAIIIGAVLLTAWTQSLRPPGPPALRIGALAVSGSALQWMITGLGLYVLLCWSQMLKLTDPPSHALILRSPGLGAALAISALQSVINYGVMAWTSVYIVTRFKQSLADVGLTFGFLVAFMGIVGPLVAGPVADWLHQRVRGGRLYVTLASLVASPLLALVVYRADSLAGFYLLFIPFSLATTLWLPPVYATFMDLVLPRMRGSVISCYILTMTIIGLGLGPFAVGLMSDISHHDIAGSILNLYWLSPFIALLVVFLIVKLPKEEASLIDRARAAGEEI
ncbi:MAG TPA: MFS transporter [Caulobacteraceae bacterium]